MNPLKVFLFYLCGISKKHFSHLHCSFTIYHESEMRGGRCCFALGSKSSNILVEALGENEKENPVEMQTCVLMDQVWGKEFVLFVRKCGSLL